MNDVSGLAEEAETWRSDGPASGWKILMIYLSLLDQAK